MGVTEPNENGERPKSPPRDARGRIERVFRIVEMTGVIALLLAALPSWGALVALVLTFLLCAYILDTVFEEIGWAMGIAEGKNGKPLGTLGFGIATVVATGLMGSTILAILYVADRLRAVIGG